MKHKIYRILRRRALRQPIVEPEPPKPHHPLPESPPERPSPRIRSRRTIATIIASVLLAHLVEVVAACWSEQVSRIFWLDLYILILGFGSSFVSAGFLIRGEMLLQFGIIERTRTPVAFWYNVLGFGILGHVMVYIACARLMHPAAV